MQRPRVLVVEDQADLRKLIALTLGGERYELFEATDGTAALESCARLRPALVLLDLMLPGELDGIDVCRRLRADPELRELKVVLLTAADQAVQRARAADAGVDRYFPKPFSPRALRELVDSLLVAPAGD